MKDEVKVAVGGDAPHAPVLYKMNPDDVISVKDAARAACSESDNRAANLLEAMEEAGIVSKPNGMGKRQILVPTRD